MRFFSLGDLFQPVYSSTLLLDYTYSRKEEVLLPLSADCDSIGNESRVSRFTKLCFNIGIRLATRLRTSAGAICQRISHYHRSQHGQPTQPPHDRLSRRSEESNHAYKPSKTGKRLFCSAIFRICECVRSIEYFAHA